MNSDFPPPTGSARRLCTDQLVALLLVASVGPCAAALASFRNEDTELKAAQKAIERREFNRARDLLNNSLQVKPDNADLHFLMARTARRAAAFKEAQRHLDECVRLRGSTEAIALERKLLRAQDGDLDKVEKPLLALVKEGHQDAALILEAMSQGYIETYRLEDAMKCLNQWLKLQPKEIQALLWRAKVREMTPQEGNLLFDANLKGLPDYQKVVAIDPEQDDARLHTAEAMLELGRPADALEQFQYLQKRQFRNSAVLLGLARCRTLMGENEEAETLLDKLLKEEPRNSSALRERGKLAIGAGQIADAEGLLRKALALDSFDYQSNYLLCLCLKQAGKTDEAEACRAKLNRIMVEQVRVKDLHKKVVEAPRDIAPRYELGLICLRNNQESEGLRWLRWVLNAEPGHKPSHLALAEYYLRAGKKELAQKHRELAGETDKAKKEPR